MISLRMSSNRRAKNVHQREFLSDRSLPLRSHINSGLILLSTQRFQKDIMKFSFLLLSCATMVNAFTPPAQLTHRASSNRVEVMMVKGDDEESRASNLSPMPLAAAAFWALTSSSAMAAGPDWGIFEGKTLSLLHPAMMAGMLGLSVSTALLGFDWRRQRTIGDDISALKKQLPDLGGASSVSQAIAAAKAAEDTVLVAKLQGSLPVEAQIKDLQTERKTLSEKGPRDKHFSQGSLLAFIGTLFAIEVCITISLFSKIHQSFSYFIATTKFLPGSPEYLRENWKTFPRTSSLCWSWISMSLGSSRGLRSCHAKRRRYCSYCPHWCESYWNWIVCLASAKWNPNLAQSGGEGTMALNVC